ncbi:MAG: putative glycoside hydrolase [Woeseiaceae bacterium]
MKYVLSILMVLVTGTATANPSDPNIHYVVAGKSIVPWELSLQFGKVMLDDQMTGETVRGSLVASPAVRNSENDAIRFKWTPKGIKNEWGTDDTSVMTISLINRTKGVDLTAIVDQAALTMDVRVIKAPNRLTTITLESAWDWQTRSDVPLKSALRSIPKNEWISVPIPLRCFLKDKEGLDFSAITGIQLQTGGKMEIEISDLRLTAFPPDKVDCG